MFSFQLKLYYQTITDVGEIDLAIILVTDIYFKLSKNHCSVPRKYWLYLKLHVVDKEGITVNVLILLQNVLRSLTVKSGQ